MYPVDYEYNTREEAENVWKSEIETGYCHIEQSYLGWKAFIETWKII